MSFLYFSFPDNLEDFAKHNEIIICFHAWSDEQILKPVFLFLLLLPISKEEKISNLFCIKSKQIFFIVAFNSQALSNFFPIIGQRIPRGGFHSQFLNRPTKWLWVWFGKSWQYEVEELSKSNCQWLPRHVIKY